MHKVATGRRNPLNDIPQTSTASGPPCAEPSAKAWPEWKASGGHILVIDDDEAIRTVIQRALITTGFTVRSAPGGREAISLFERESGRFILVILDLRMPGMDPKEIVERLRATNPAVRILLMSGYNRQKALQHTLSLQLCGFLPKPFTLKELVAKVREVTGA